jgi:hypothetical protein
MLLAIGLFGCSPPSGRDAGREFLARPQQVTLSLELAPGTKTRYRVITAAVTGAARRETAPQEDASTAPLPTVSESTDVVFTQEILGPAPGDANVVVAFVTIDQVRYVRTCPGESDLAFDSEKPADQNSPFARLIGQRYTIEIHPLGHVLGAFNLRPARLAVRGGTRAHGAALDLVSPPAIFSRHGSFTLPGSDVGSLAVGDRWRGVKQFTLEAPGTSLTGLGTHRFEKIYRLERLEERPEGAVAVAAFAGSPLPRRTADGRLAEVPFLSCSYVGGVEFNLDAGRVEGYVEHLDVRMPLPGGGSSPQGRIATATRLLRVRRLDLD